MKNFVFISPNFPKTYYLFARALKNQGFNVLGIASDSYDALDLNLKESLTEYYRVENMDSYENMYQAVAYYAYKYGKIDFIDSNNEYYLETDARLRSDFNIKTGKNASSIRMFKSKELQKKYYAKAKVKTARYQIISTFQNAQEFIEKVGYPVVVKPDCGVGANKTYKLKTEKDLREFFLKKESCKYIMEEYIDGDLISFDGICNGKSNVVFCSNEVFPNTIMDVVNEQSEVYYYANKDVPNDLKEIGQRVLKAFHAQYRYFHLEFFRLKKDTSLGKKGEIIGLEVNMRAPGGYTPDLINFAHSVDSYKIYAEVLDHETTSQERVNENYYVVYVARRDFNNYIYSSEKILQKYGTNILMHDKMPTIISGALGNEFFVSKVKTFEELINFKNDILLKDVQ